MKKLTAIAAAAVISTALVGCGGQELKPAKNGYNQQKVVYHVNNVNTAFGALRNVKNHLNALGDKNSEIIVVTHSSGAFAMVDGTKDKKGKSFDAVIKASVKLVP